jgi:hypothetical protein
LKVYQHFDKLGRELAVGDCIAYNSHFGGLTVGRVEKINRERIKIIRLTESANMDWEFEFAHPCNTVLLDSKDVTFYLLKK